MHKLRRTGFGLGDDESKTSYGEVGGVLVKYASDDRINDKSLRRGNAWRKRRISVPLANETASRDSFVVVRIIVLND